MLSGVQTTTLKYNTQSHTRLFLRGTAAWKISLNLQDLRSVFTQTILDSYLEGHTIYDSDLVGVIAGFSF